MSLLHPHLRQHLHAIAFKASHPAPLDEEPVTLMTDSRAQQEHIKADEVFAAGYTEFRFRAVVWLVVSVAIVCAAYLIANYTAADVLGWLADAGDTLMGHRAAAVLALPMGRTGAGIRTVMLRFSAVGGRIHTRPAELLRVLSGNRLAVRVWGDDAARIVAAESVVAQGEEA